MGTSALRRLIAEYKQILKNAPDGIMAGPIKEENYFEWEAAITGPEGTLFEDGVFLAKLIFPQVIRVLHHPIQNFSNNYFSGLSSKSAYHEVHFKNLPPKHLP